MFAHVPIALHQETQIHFAFAVTKYDLPCFILNFFLTLLKDILMVENETKCRKPQSVTALPQKTVHSLSQLTKNIHIFHVNITLQKTNKQQN